MEKLSLETKTLYAELLEQLVALEARRSIGHLPGCFTSKRVKGEEYCYFQYSEPGGVLRQVYLGKKSPRIDKAISDFKQGRGLFSDDAESLERLCAQLRAGGALAADAASARVLKALSEAGIFRLGGVLVGTHAFAALGNMLGVRWGASAKTEDVDIAGRRRLDLAVPELRADVPKTLELLGMGFLPVPSLNPKGYSTSFKVRGGALRVDILTPASPRGGEGAVFIPRLNTAAQPLRFLDYLMEDRQQAAVVGGGGILVNVPSPARFVFHKLIVSSERGSSMHAKSEKDVAQAARVISVLAEERPGDLVLAWEDVQRRGGGWVKRVRRGLAALKKAHPAEFDGLCAAVKGLGKAG